ncbi:tripartite tricarboxylate transporter substrate binding protein [Verticiella sediminum]|uniref:Tripartite tricarboxylate transporter substrate binding protein n=2 Tax=Verticiella sediminum TaxID=1247510 RepID=A0A556A6L8_9BURK|nr:tripartite tricarboxylate transporter substrate binding protein [Verticiella sediminum]
MPAIAAYPERAITVIVPYQAGGSTDTVARRFADLAGKRLGQQIIIENKGGAGATLGAREMARAKPDGYTLAIIPSPVFRLPHVQDAGYDPNRDLTYISMISGYTLGVAVPEAAPYESWEALLEAARAKPGAISYGTASVGSASNVMMEQIARHYGIEWEHIPYKGENDVLQNVMGGLLEVYAGSSTVRPFVEDGRMRMLVTWGETRSRIFPDTPTLHELEPDIEPMYAPFGIAGPRGLPPEITSGLDEVFREIIESDEFQQILVQFGQEPVYMNSEDYTEYARAQYALEADIVKQLGLASH